jgi:hypothetical protein
LREQRLLAEDKHSHEKLQEVLIEVCFVFVHGDFID